MNRKTIIYTAIGIMFAAALAGQFFLPDTIAVQWNSGGVSNVASKIILFVFPALALLCESRTHSLGQDTAPDKVLMSYIITGLLFAAQTAITIIALV